MLYQKSRGRKKIAAFRSESRKTAENNTLQGTPVFSGYLELDSLLSRVNTLAGYYHRSRALFLVVLISNSVVHALFELVFSISQGDCGLHCLAGVFAGTYLRRLDL